jgi:hypothetical protein
MDTDMLAQIQQMLTSATESLRQDIRQEMSAMEARLGNRIDEVKWHGDERIEEVMRHGDERIEEVKRHGDERFEEVMRHGDERFEEVMRHGDERFEEVKRHAGVLYEDLRDKLALVIEGQQFLGQRIDTVHADLVVKNHEMQVMIGAMYNQLNARDDSLEQRIRNLEQR